MYGAVQLGVGRRRFAAVGVGRGCWVGVGDLMKHPIFWPTFTLSLAAVASIAAGCGGGDGDKAVLSLALTDAPGDYARVDVTVSELSVHRVGTSTEADDGGWITIATPNLSIDLLTLRNGVTLPVGTATIAAGSYNNLRLVVSRSTVTLRDGTVDTLEIPSGSQRGVQIKYDFDLPANVTTQLVLDFDAEASIHQTGNGKRMMRPVLSVKSRSDHPHR